MWGAMSKISKSKVMTPRGLARRIRDYPARPPVTTRFERVLMARKQWNTKGVWYKSQKVHWLGWLSEYDGPGFYNRQNGKRSAEFVYNHINCAPMVLWLGEVSGISKTKVSEAKRAALSARGTLSSQCAAIRKVIPWRIIEAMVKRDV